MQDFDAARINASDDHRQFKLVGQTFTIRKRVRPEVLTSLDVDGDSTQGTIDQLSNLVRQVLISDDRPRWDAARAQDDDDEAIIDIDDLKDVAEWALKVLTGRPLDNAASSTGTSSAPAPPSLVDVSSPVAAPQTG